MKPHIIKQLSVFFIATSFCLFFSCKKESVIKSTATNFDTKFIVHKDFSKKNNSPEFKNYWYTGKAEISSYKLEQARYGKIREGHAVLVFVTEDFLPKPQVKADNQNPTNIPILKLNATKNFVTGIYPYSIMQSTFYPVVNTKHALKVSASVQEWCGHVYVQLNNREQFEINSHSYFEGEADAAFKINKTILENELWTKLRINPQSLPTGQLQIIPSLEHSRLQHLNIKAYNAHATLNANTYSINYPELNRTLSITFNPKFPFDILSWEDTYKSGFGTNAKVLTTKATKLKTIKLAYWEKKNLEDESLRDTLKLN
ncbi:septum formation inhibitor Maf [Algibacter sp. PT7-4]|uniref:septum formation inhibitor Maf n=1 Tax=Algibacter ulvanivorans TaxID=3400999 RepID=UPI003AAE9108